MFALCHHSDIDEGRAKGFEINGKYLFAVKKDDQIHLYYNYCPHLGTPLEWIDDDFLDPDGAYIRCSTHGALFVIDNGHCVMGPCKGKSLLAIPFELGNGYVMVDANYIATLGRI